MRIIKAIFWWVLSVLLLGMVVPCSQAESSYLIYESELKNIRKELDNIRQEKQSLIEDLTKSKLNLEEAERRRTDLEKKLADLEQKLIDYQNRLGKQEAELTALSDMRKELWNQLTELTESFQEYKKEAEGKIRRLVIQRNIIGGLSMVLMIIAL
jgi:chromosome segregation ATPase